MKHLLKVLPLLLLAVLVLGLVSCSTEIVDPGDMPDIGTLPASYTVTFCDRNGNVIKTSTVREGEAAALPSASMIPVIEGYDFVGWDADLTQVTGDMTVTARYARSEYTVNFRMPDGSLIESRTFARLSDTTAPDVPEVEGKHFVGWAFAEGTAVDPAIVRFDAELYAVYEANVYKVTFVDAEGSVTVDVKHGSAAKAPVGRAPEGKRFDAWDADFSHVTSDMTVHATYVTVHTVRFVDHDGTVIGDVQIVDEGADATPPADPTRTGYTFTGWDKGYTSVGADITVTATYTINTYTVTFLDADDSLLRSIAVQYGGSATPPDLVVPEGKLFKEWQKADGTVVSDFTGIDADLTVKAVYVRAVTVLFYAMDGATELARFVIPKGTGVTAPPVPVVDGYRFVGWSADFTAVTEDLSVVARYIRIRNVTFVDFDGTVLASAAVDEGTAAAAPADPTREGYTFAGWDKDFSSVTVDMTVTARYDIKVYTVRFIDWTGDVLSTAEVNWNTAAIAPAADAVTARVDWSFDGWDKAYDAIVADTDIHAVMKPDFTVIASAEDLLAMAGATSGFYGLTADLDLTGWDASVTFDYDSKTRIFTLAGGLTLAEGVTFTGDGHSITGLTGPLFGYIKGSIRNCTIDGAAIKLKGIVGAFAAEISGKLTDCHVKNTTITSDGDYSRIGLFAGDAADGASFTDCTVDGNSKVTGWRNLTVGGFAARATGNVTFTRCESDANLSGFTGKAISVGGFVGKAEGATLTFDACIANATIVIAQDDVKAAGMVAFMDVHPTTVTITNGKNTGHIVINGNNAVAAGAVAYNFRAGYITIDGFENRGEIGATGNAAGVVAYVESGNGKTPCQLTVTNADNYAVVSGKTAGGIVGVTVTTLNLTAITDSDNYGTVSGTEFAGGIIGRFEAGNNTSSRLEMAGCVSRGTVSATENGAYAGGLVGDLRAWMNVSFTVDGCTVAGTVTAADTAEAKAAAGGVFGRVYTTVANYMPKVADTQITAAVSGCYAGGVVGEYCTQNRTEDYGDAKKYTVVGYFFNDSSVNAKLSVTRTTVGATLSGTWTAVMVGTANGNGILTIESADNTYNVTGSFITYYSRAFVAGEEVTYWKRGAAESSTATAYVPADSVVVHKDAIYGDEKTVIFLDEDNSEIAKTYVENNGHVTAPASPSKSGFVFVGWTADGGATILAAADIAALTISADVTYTAVYEAREYTVIFKDGDTTLSEADVAYGNAPALPDVIAPDGKALVGWSDGNTTYTAEEMAGYTVTGNVTFTAVWGDVVTVTFIDENYTSAAGDHVWATVKTGKGGSITPPADPANCPDMTFLGWSDGTNTYNAAQIAALTIDGNVTFTAVYTGVTYTVTFKNSNGDLIDTVTAGYGAAVNRPAADPKRVMPVGIGDCFTFAGWLCNGEAYDFGTPVSGDLTLVASYVFDESNAAGVIGISDLAGLKAIEAGKTYVLTADIEIDSVFWTSTASRLVSDNVAIDGDGHTVSMKAGLSAEGALFADTTSGNFYLHNVTFDGFNTVCDNQGIVLANFKGSELYVTNVHMNDCNLSSRYSGPFACDVGGTAVIENCSVTNFTSTMKSSGNMSGFIGSPLQSVVTDITFRNCKVSATFNINGKTVNDGIGGFIGTSNKSTQSTITFENCIANSTVVAASIDAATMEKIGGFIGKIKGFNKAPGHTVVVTGGESSCTWTSDDGTVTKFAVAGACTQVYKVTVTAHTENGTLIENETKTN